MAAAINLKSGTGVLQSKRYNRLLSKKTTFDETVELALMLAWILLARPSKFDLRPHCPMV